MGGRRDQPDPGLAAGEWRLSALQRAVLNTGQTSYAEIQAELYEQGIDLSETAVRKAMRAVVDTSQS